MQYCKKCGYGMDDNVTKCPRCGKKTGKSSAFSKVLMIIIILIVFIIFCPMCTGFNNARNRSKSSDVTKAPTITAKEAVSEVSEADETSTNRQQEDIATQEEQATEGDFLAVASSIDYDLKVTDWEISTDYDNKPVLVVYYEYTNKKDTPTAFMWAFTDKVFQNGIELDDTTFGVNEVNNNQSKDIQQDTTAPVVIAYKLQDTTNPVNITVEEYNIFKSDDYIISETIDIQK